MGAFFIPITNAVQFENENNHILNQDVNDLSIEHSKLKYIFNIINHEPGWFPGFFLIQLFKVAIGLLFIILIIFKMIIPLT